MNHWDQLCKCGHRKSSHRAFYMPKYQVNKCRVRIMWEGTKLIDKACECKQFEKADKQ